LVAPVLRATFWVGNVTLEPDLPLVYYDASVSEQSATFFGSTSHSGLLIGNPTFAAKYHFLNETMDASVGAGISFPAARLDETSSNSLWKAFGYGGALGTRGAWNYWWYAPNSLTLFLPAKVRYVSKQGLDVGLEGALGLLLYTGDGSRDPLGDAQIGMHVGYASSFIEAGLRLRGVRIPGTQSDEKFQASMEPYVEALFDHAYVGAGFLFNINKPLGPFLDTGSIWGLRVDGGARF
jgi:hypothetical protein